MVERVREVKGVRSVEQHFYLSSMQPDAERIASAIRSHWGVENNLHWLLDVAFNEDRQRIRNKLGAENLGTINRIALMLLQRDRKKSVRMQRKLAGWDGPFLLSILSRGFSIS